MHGSLFLIENAAHAVPEALAPCAVSIRAEPVGDLGATDAMLVREPKPARLVRRQIELETALDSRPTGDLATLIYLPAGNGTPYELQKRAELWMASRPDEHGAAVEVPFRSERILWRIGRALVIGRGEYIQDVQQAVSLFSFCEAQLSPLEQQIAGQWSTLDADLSLTHSVGRNELAQQAQIDFRTSAAHRMRIELVRLETALERLDAVLSPPAQRIFSELAVQRDIVDRLRLLDDAIEVAQEVYDTANDRLTEYRYFHREYRIEVMITFILLFELIVMALEAWRHWHN